VAAIAAVKSVAGEDRAGRALTDRDELWRSAIQAIADPFDVLVGH
jgi:hypothetical protein